MDKSNNKLLWALLLLLFCGLSIHLSWRFYKNSITRFGCVVADNYCSITGGGELCDRYKTIKYETFCLPPVGIDEWLEYRSANQDVLDTMLTRSNTKEMMQKGEFEKLEHYFLDVQSRYENHEINEFTYIDMMFELKHDDDEAVALYGDWLKSIPDSYIARFGRGSTNNKIGWNKRGTKFAKDTPRENMIAMRMYHKKAAYDLRAAVALHPKLTMAYNDLVSIANYGPGALGRDHWLAESIKYDPYNYIVRKSYIWKLLPQWGGSHHEMHEFASSALEYVDKNPLLRGLAAVEFFDMASRYRAQKRYDKAIENGFITLYHRPDGNYYQYLAYSYEEAKRYKEAIRYAEEGLKQEPEDIQLLHRYAYSSREDHQYEKAEDGFARLTKLRPKTALYWYSRALIYFRLKKYLVAMPFLKKSHELEPSNNKYLYWYAISAIRNNEPIGLVKMRSFLERCKSSKCRRQDISWAGRWIDCVDGKSTCDLPDHDYVGWQKSPLYSP